MSTSVRTTSSSDMFNVKRQIQM